MQKNTQGFIAKGLGINANPTNKKRTAPKNRYHYQQAPSEPAYTPTIDYGPAPFAVDIEKATLANDNYRRTLWTGPHLQLTLMSINPGDDIGLEVHPDNDQFLRIEQGSGEVQMGPHENTLAYSQQVYDGFAVFVPAGTWHNIINTGKEPMRIYAIYSPSHHPHGTVHETKEIAQIEGD